MAGDIIRKGAFTDELNKLKDAIKANTVNENFSAISKSPLQNKTITNFLGTDDAGNLKTIDTGDTTIIDAINQLNQKIDNKKNIVVKTLLFGNVNLNAGGACVISKTFYTDNGLQYNDVLFVIFNDYTGSGSTSGKGHIWGVNKDFFWGEGSTTTANVKIDVIHYA